MWVKMSGRTFLPTVFSTTLNQAAQESGWGFSGMENLNSFDLVSRQAKKFIEGHMPMRTIIGELGSVN